MFQKLHDKDIDLLDAYKRKKEPSKHEQLIKYAILPLVLLVVMIAVFGFFKMQELNIASRIDEVNQEIIKLEEDQKAGDKQAKYQILLALQQELSGINVIDSNIDSYPELSKPILDGIFNTMYGLADIKQLSYNQKQNMLSLSVTTTNVTMSDRIIRELKKTDLFLDVSYSGYAQEAEQVKEVIQIPSEETTETTETPGTTETPVTPVNSNKVYRINIQCVMKKVVEE